MDLGKFSRGELIVGGIALLRLQERFREGRGRRYGVPRA
jgi:hypothetical protein